MIPIEGALFPGWILVLGLAFAGTVAAVLVLRLVGLAEAIPLRPVFNLALFVLIALVLWDVMYGG
jgi:hypothetical protein